MNNHSDTPAATNHPSFEQYRDLPVCVTGGAGFIGSHIVAALVDLGARVRVLDNFVQGRRENLALYHDRIELIEGDLRDAAVCERAIGDAAVVLHLAALGSVPQSVERPAEYHEVNATGTLQLLETARRRGVRRVVFSASSSAYGNLPSLPKVESMCPVPESPYAVAKLAGEHWITAYALCYGLEGVSLRYFNIFGPRQRPDSPYAAVIPAFASALLEGRKPVIYGDGEQTRDFTHVSNVVRANLLAGVSATPLKGEVLNIGCGTRYSVLQLLQTMADLLGAPADAEHRPTRAGEVRDSQASIEAARTLIGYEPLVSFEEGLADTMRWFREQHQPA